MTRLLDDIGRSWAVAGGVSALLVLVESLGTAVAGEPVGAYVAYVACVLLAALTGASVALADRRPGAALAVAWLSYPVWLATGTPALLSQVPLVLVAFSCGRRGGRAVLVAAVATSLVAPPLVVYTGSYARVGALGAVLEPVARVLDGTLRPDLLGGSAGAVLSVLVVLLLGIALLLSPVATGYAVRLADRSRRSEAGRRLAVEQREESRQEAEAAHADAETARALARLQEQHAQLARDVHDVVGHSLTVVIAQAEAAQYAADDPAALKATLQGVADTARSSLTDVRRVLTATPDGDPDDSTGAPGGWAADPLPGMVDGLRAGGLDVQVSQEGTPRPLPPELATVTHRVTQEMLTNAARHGAGGGPVLVERHWDGDELRLEVRNGLCPSRDDETRPLSAAPEPAGSGLTGMRSRLAGVGGRLDVRRREADGTFTATAWIPLRPAATTGRE